MVSYFNKFESLRNCTHASTTLYLNAFCGSPKQWRRMPDGGVSAAPEGDCGSIDARRKLAEEVQLLLRASGSPNATCNIVQLQCRLSEYRGGILDMTEEAALAASALSSSHTEHGEDILMTPELPASQMPHRLLLPDWDKLFDATAGAAPKPARPTGEAVAALVVRQKGQRKAFSNRASSVSSQASVEKSDSTATPRRLSCNELNDSVDSLRQSPPIRPDYLKALQLLHERQRQWRARKSQQRDMDTQSAPESASHTEEALQLAAPPPFRELPPAEAIFSRVTEYLGCLSLDMPMSSVSNEAFFFPVVSWIRLKALPYTAYPAQMKSSLRCSRLEFR